jgi:serine/threonine protein kinase
MPAARPEEGTTSNRYQVLGRLAGGGMADIYLAKSTSEGGVERYVVLKRVLAERSRDPHFATMFLDEARLAAQLQHPNIAQVLDIGTLGGSYFFTMEYVHGEDVRVLLQGCAGTGRALPINLAVHIAAGALAALQHAHMRTGTDGRPLGIVHRDVSPSNVMVSYEGAVKLLDFGVAKAAQQTEQSQSGSIKGKIGYLSPEQCKGKGIDKRSDIFALGVVLFEMLTMQRLYKRDNDFAAMMAIATEPPPLPSSIRPGISPGLDHIVMTALAKEPEQRYATAADMLEALEEVAAHARMVLSATAMGRFLRELFGVRPEPWAALPAPRVTQSEMTEVSVTSSFGSLLEVEEAALLDQLEHAPMVGRGDATSGVSLPAVGQTTMPVADVDPMTGPTVQMTGPTAPMRMPPSAHPPFPDMYAPQATASSPMYRPPPMARALEPEPLAQPSSRRGVIIGVAGATIVVGALLIWKLAGSGTPTPHPVIAPVVLIDAAVGEPAAAAPPPPPAAPIDASVVAKPADAAVPAPDAAIAKPKPPPPAPDPQPLAKPKPKPPKPDPCDVNPLKCQK